MADFFNDEAFEKELHVGDSLPMDKNGLKKVRITLDWTGTDLDLAAFMVKNGKIHQKNDLVYFQSELRWKTKLAFNDENFAPLDGIETKWPDEDFVGIMEMMESTLPISPDGSVIGSWDDIDDDDNVEDGNDDDENNSCQEVMHVNLRKLNQHLYDSVVFVAAVAEDRIRKGKTFRNAHNPVVRIYNAETGEPIARFQLDREFPNKCSVCFGRLVFR